MKKFLITCEETCPDCKGEGFKYSEEWARCLDELTIEESRNDNCILDWFERERGYRAFDIQSLPEEEYMCSECEGEKIIRREVNFEEALQYYNVHFSAITKETGS